MHCRSMEKLRMAEKRKVDRRVQRTRQALFAALMALLMEKNYADITVADIADRANVGRATFYLHYKDKDDLLASNLEGLFAEVAERIRPLLKQSLIAGDKIQGRILFEEAQQHSDLYRMILSGQGGVMLQTRLQSRVAGLISEILETMVMGGESPIEISLLANYLTGTILSIVQWWLENDMPHSPDYMAAVMQQLVRPGMERVLMLGMDWYEKGGGEF
ncbi:MAG: TetR/AcrR family transcriptional regulator [Candidatus Thermofonsia bacterium]|nr:MAG: TetR/AcrR family transcriptional regulator [Candidatus Thermofonsia bacterium]